jgi:hypothetical protein
MKRGHADDAEDAARRVAARVEDRPLSLELMDLPDDALVTMVAALPTETRFDVLWRLNQHMRTILDTPRHAVRIWDEFEARFLRVPLGLGPAAPQGMVPPSRARFNTLLDQHVVTPLWQFIRRALTDDRFLTHDLPTQNEPVHVIVDIYIAGGMHAHDAGEPLAPGVMLQQQMTLSNIAGTRYLPGIAGRRHHAAHVDHLPAALRAHYSRDDFYGDPAGIPHVASAYTRLAIMVAGTYPPWLRTFVHAYGHDTAVTVTCTRVSGFEFRARPNGDLEVPTVIARLMRCTMSVATGMQVHYDVV